MSKVKKEEINRLEVYSLVDKLKKRAKWDIVQALLFIAIAIAFIIHIVHKGMNHWLIILIVLTGVFVVVAVESFKDYKKTKKKYLDRQ